MLNNEFVWDQTNIGENYPGTTLPLTYSFVKDAYSNVYRNFLLTIGVKRETIDQNRYIFDNMLGYIKGHVFYNIENWYNMLQLLPAYKYNQKFFEDMLDPAVKKKYATKQVKPSPNFLVGLQIIIRFFLSILFFDKLHTRFEKEFASISNEYEKLNLLKLNNFELASTFESIQQKFFSLWSITIINDFKVMIFFGMLKKFTDTFGKEAKEILKDIYSIKNQPRSILPLKKIVNLALEIKKNKQFEELFTQDSKKVWQSLNDPLYTSLDGLIRNYLKQYGERSSNELKLEEAKFKEKPQAFIDLIKYYTSLDTKTLSTLYIHTNLKGKTYIPSKCSFFNRIILNFLKESTIKGIYKREYYRMKRGKAFNMAREMFLETGRRLVTAKDLQKKTDVFFLYKNEVFDYLRFHCLKNDFKTTVNYRKQLLKIYKKEQLSRRVKTHGLPGEEKITIRTLQTYNYLQGQATAKGTVEGEVIVMKTLDLKADYKGKILVTIVTDPGWTVIFPLLKGVIAEHGGLLSHASIVARELGIPCMVKVNDATKILKNGQKIKMDTQAGKIIVLN